MDCQNCGKEIPAEWIKAINSLHLLGEQISFVLKCQECGEPVMDNNALQLLGGLTSMLEEKASAQEIMSWLLSNYQMKRVEGEEKPGFRTRSLVVGAFDEADKQKRLNEFLSRANASPNLVGKSRKDLMKENPNLEGGTEVTLDEDENGVIDIGDEYKDPAMENVDVSQYEDPTMMELDPSNKMPLALRSLLQKNLQKQSEARDNVLSGIRTNENGFTRGG